MRHLFFPAVFFASLFPGSMLFSQQVLLEKARFAFENKAYRDVVNLLQPIRQKYEQNPADESFTSWVWLLGRSYAQLNQIDSSFQVAHDALAIAPTAGANKENIAAWANALLGQTSYKADRINDVISYCSIADSLDRKVQVLKGTYAATMYNAYAVSLEETGRLHQARTMYLKGLSKITGMSRYDRITRGILSNNLGTLHRALGNHEEAVALLRADLIEVLDLYGAESMDAAQSYINIGNVLYDQGDMRSALEYMLRADGILRKIEQPAGVQTGIATNMLGVFHKELGSFQESELAFKRSFEARTAAFGKDHYQLAVAHVNLSEVYQLQSRIREALFHARKAVALREAKLQFDDWRLFSSRLNLAQLYCKTGKRDSALIQRQEMQKALSGELKYSVRNQADAFLLDGELAEKAGLYREAMEHYNNSQRILRTGQQQPVSWLTPVYAFRNYTNYVRLAAKHADVQTLIAATDTLYLVYKNAQLNLESPHSMQQLTRQFHATNAPVVLRLITEADRTKNTAMLDEAFRVADITKSATLRQVIRENEAKNFAGIPEAELDTERKLARLIRKMESDLAFQQNKETKAMDSLLYVKNKRNQILERFARDYPRYYALQYASPKPDLNNLRSRLPKDAVRLDFYESDSLSVLFVSRRSATKVLMLEAGNGLSILRNAFTQAVVTGDTAGIIQIGTKIARPILELDATILNGPLFISTNGGWINFPFEALPAPDNSYWGGKTPITYLLSADPLSTVSRRSWYSYIGFAPVTFSDEKSVPTIAALRNGKAPLPFSATEVAESKAIFDKALPWYSSLTSSVNRVFIRDAATETALKAVPVEASTIVHFATHTVIDETGQHRSFLRLRKTDSDDGIFQQQEIFGRPFPVAMIVLNSCASASGEIIPGEGVWGLTAAFRYAGAQRIAATRWPVNDQPSAAFTRLFFEALAAGRAPAEAMFMARKQAIVEGSAFKVRDWAAYQLLE
jgi:CHAT domain-containing protein